MWDRKEIRLDWDRARLLFRLGSPWPLALQPSIWNFYFENGGKCQICCSGELLSEEKHLTAHSVEKIRRSCFALIRTHFRQFVKPWPHATSCQEVEHGANLRANTQMESNDAFHQSKTGSWAGVPGRLPVKPAHQKSQREMGRALARSSQASTSRQQTHVTLTNKLGPPQGQRRAVSLSHTNPDLVWVPSEETPGKDPGPGLGLRSLFLQGPTAASTHHWGSEKGGTSSQVCKGGGKLVFSQGSSHRKGANASCPNQSEFRNHSDVWFVRHRVERGCSLVNGNCDFPPSKTWPWEKSSWARPVKEKLNGLHAWDLGFSIFFF